MHISEGVLSPTLLLGGAVLAGIGTAVGLKRMDYDQVVHVALLTATFYLASLVHVPIGPASAHLVLNGLLGLLLGWAAVPAILVALLLHAVMFQYGGLTVLGVNTVIMAGPALVCWLLFRAWIRRGKALPALASFFCGALGVFLGALLLGAFLALNGEPFHTAAQVAVLAHVPVMVLEGLVTMVVVGFLLKVKPELLQGAVVP